MEDQPLIEIINTQMGLNLPLTIAFAEMRLRLQAAVAHLLDKHFEQLVSVLYRVDVNERKLKYLLQENVGEEAAVIIADLIIERQLEKLRLRKQYSRPDDNTSEEEKW